MGLQNIIPELAVLGIAILVLVLDLFVTDKNRFSLAWVAAAGILGALYLSITRLSAQGFVLVENNIATTAGFVVDPLTLFMRIAILFAVLLIVLASIKTMSVKGFGEYLTLILFSTLGAMTLAGANDLITLFLGLELISIPSYILVAIRKNNQTSGEAAVKYLVLGLLSTAVMLFGMSYIYGLTGETNLRMIASLVSSNASIPALIGILMLSAGMAFKLAAVPFHFWAPDAYDGAANPVAAFLSAIPKLGVAAVLIRLFVVTLPVLKAEWVLIFTAMSIITMVVGTVLALPQSNIKRLLAYSSIANAGFILIGMSLASPAGLSAMLFYVFVYAIGTIGAFFVIAACSGDEDASAIEDYSGLGQKNPLLALAMTFFVLSLIGIPPFAGFMGKLYLFGAAIKSEEILIAVVGVIMTVVSVGYYIKILREMYLGKPEGDKFDIPVGLKLAISLAVIGIIGLGLYHAPVFNMIQEAVK